MFFFPELLESLASGNLYHISQKMRLRHFMHSQILTLVTNIFLQHLSFFRLTQIQDLQNCVNIISLHIALFELKSCCFRHCTQITSRLSFIPNYSLFLFIGLRDNWPYQVLVFLNNYLQIHPTVNKTSCHLLLSMTIIHKSIKKPPF